MADEESFVRRWSRRKSAARAEDRPSEPAPASPVAEPSPTAEPQRRDATGDAIDPAALPAIDSLTYQSDFTVFLQAGVPPELRKRALRHLWRSDPIFAHRDGLVEYGEDYSQVGITPQIVRTAYQVGRGMLERIEAAAAPSSDQPPEVGPPARDGGDAARAEAPAIEGRVGEDDSVLPAANPIPKSR